MAQADCVFITPPTDASRLQNIAEQEAARQASIALVRQLRREAGAEIERLLAFMDASDTYVMTELEDDGDQADASYPESGVKVCSPMEDDEDSDVDEDSDPAEESEPSGIGDYDGLLEQLGSQDLAVRSAGMTSRKPFLPANEDLDAAIAAHQDALRDGDTELGHLLLRVVVMARTPAPSDLRRMLGYLTSLPIARWPSDRGEPADIRAETLAGRPGDRPADG